MGWTRREQPWREKLERQLIGSLSLRGYTEGIDHEPAADRYDVKVVKVVFQYEIRSSKTASGAKLKLQNRGGRNKPTRRMASSFYWHAAGKDPTGPRTIAMQGQRG